MTQPVASKRLRKDIVDALRLGSVPTKGLHLFATGMQGFERTANEELADAAAGRGRFKAIRAPYGGGKTFFSRWLQSRALDQNFVVSEVQIATDTPLHQLQTVYRRAMERLSSREQTGGAFRTIVDGWLLTLEQELREAHVIDEKARPHVVREKVGEALESKLVALSAKNHHFAAVLRAYHQATIDEDEPAAEGLLAWLSGVEGISASIKKRAGITGGIDHRMALGFFQGLLLVLRASGRSGLVLVLDEVETIQRQRSDSRAKSLQGLRQIVDDIVSGSLPGMYLLATGTPEFFESPWGVAGLDPLKQRLETHFDADPRFDNPRAVQIRLPAFDEARLTEVGAKIRDLYPGQDEDRLRVVVNDAFIRGLVDKIVGAFRGRVGVAPRIFLRKLIDVLDRVDTHADFDPAQHFRVDVRPDELNADERVAAGIAVATPEATSPDVIDIQLDEA